MTGSRVSERHHGPAAAGVARPDARASIGIAHVAGVATSAGGLIIIGLGITYTARAPRDEPSTPWLLLSALATALLAAGLARIGSLCDGWPGRIGLHVGRSPRDHRSHR